MSPDPGHYDRAYFDKWYRHPRHRVKSARELALQSAYVLHAAEWLLGRRVRTVLDVGCGEGQWRQALRALRPALRYTGVDPSEYVVERYGKRRNIRLGGIDSLDALDLDSAYDLVVCCGMLNYVPIPKLEAGLAQVARRTGGMAYLEIFTRDDAIEGDTNWPVPRRASWYRSRLDSAGFVSVGMHSYVVRGGAISAGELEMFPSRD